MSHIVLTEEQLQAIAAAGDLVAVMSPGGEPLGSLSIFSPEEREAIARFKRTGGKSKSCVPGERVQAFLRQLHEVADRGELNPAKVQELLQRTSP